MNYFSDLEIKIGQVRFVPVDSALFYCKTYYLHSVLFPLNCLFFWIQIFITYVHYSSENYVLSYLYITTR